MDYTKSRKPGKTESSGFYNSEVSDFQRNHSRGISEKTVVLPVRGSKTENEK